MKIKTLLIVLCLALYFPCFAGKKKQADIMDSWLNSTKHALIMSWGPPAVTADDGDGGQIVIYSTYRGYFNGQSYYRYQMFYVNADNKIYYWRIENQTQPPTQVNLNIYHR